jgi:hypothetical protein
MQQAATAEATPSFAGLLASLAAPAFTAANPDSIWNEDGLADDVAVLSDRGAKLSDLSDGSVGADPSSTEKASITSAGIPEPGQTPRDLKRTSITVRLTEAECAQLRARAAESGLTISAYLRSCTVEVESLRAQVKVALAEMKSAAARENHSVALKPNTAPNAWFMRLWPRRRGSEVARA